MRKKVSLLRGLKSTFLRLGSPAIVTIACAAAVLVFFASLNIQAQIPERRILRIGIVDISKILDTYSKKEDSNKVLQEFQLEKQDKIDKKRVEIRTKMEKRDLLLPGSSERRKLDEELSDLEVELGIMQKAAAREIREKYAQLLIDLYDDIVQECESYAKAKKFDLILKKENLEFQGLTPQEVKFNIKTQKIVYNAPQLDITSAIIERLVEEEQPSSETTP